MGNKIAYLGPKGSYTLEASLRYFGENNEFIPVNRVTDIFNEITHNEVNFGVVPAENSIGGSVADTLDLFVNTDLKVFDRITLKIVQNLMSRYAINDIKKIFSHPQSLMQCAGYITQNFPEIECIDTFSNSKACLMASTEPNSAAIGPRLCADEYGLNILEENINDRDTNETRFYIVSNKINNSLKSKSLVIFSVPNKSGSLFEILKVFKKLKFNMTRIESRPSKIKNWEYVFIIEYENSGNKTLDKQIIEELKKKCEYFDYLGTY